MFLLILLFVYALFQLMRFFIKFKIPRSSIFIMGFFEYIFIIGALACSILILQDHIPFIYGRKISSTMLLGFNFTFIALSASCLVEDLTNKKIRTLWRLPVIGILLGYYIDLNYSFLVVAFTFLSFLVVYYQRRNDYLYIFRQLIMACIFITIGYGVGLLNSWLSLVFIFIGITFIYEILNAFMIKFYLLDKGSEA